jgi:hypothetical protein
VRQGTPGARYPNRRDLQAGPRKVPVMNAPSSQYGQGAALKAAQQAVPMASGPMQSGAPATPPGAPDPMSAALNFQPTTPVVPIHADTTNPNEPVTAGLPTGPGAGPPPMPVANDPLLHGAAILNALGDNASPAVKALRNVLNATQANTAAP